MKLFGPEIGFLWSVWPARATAWLRASSAALSLFTDVSHSSDRYFGGACPAMAVACATLTDAALEFSTLWQKRSDVCCFPDRPLHSALHCCRGSVVCCACTSAVVPNRCAIGRCQGQTRARGGVGAAPWCRARDTCGRRAARHPDRAGSWWARR